MLFLALRERIPTQLILAHALREHIPAQMVLVHAPRERALAAHLIHPQWDAICAGWFSQRLQNWYGFSAKAAQWTVESCSSALNIAPPVKYLTPTGKPLTFVNEIMLRILRHDPRAKAWVPAEVLARQKAKEHDEAVAAARQRVKEWRPAEAGARKSERERAAAVSKTQQLAKERAAAESKTQQLAKECAAADSDALRLAKKLAIAKTTVQQLARKQAATEKTARLRSKEWSLAAAAARKMVKKRIEAEAMARQTEEKSVEIILQNLKQNSLTSREAAAVLKTEQEQAIALLKRLLSDNQIEFTWSKWSPYAPCYQPAKHATTPTLAKEQSPPRQSGCLWLLALPGLLGLLAVLG